VAVHPGEQVEPGPPGDDAQVVDQALGLAVVGIAGDDGDGDQSKR